jgi:PTS system mannitol-specific IIA component
MMNVLDKSKIRVNVKVHDKEEAIRMAGQLLAEAGHVSESYIDAMLERERISSTYMGAGLAIPHGTNEAKSLIRSTGLSVLTIPEGVSFDGNTVNLVVGIAASGDQHMELLTNIAMIVSDPDQFEHLMKATDEEQVLAIFEEGALA